MSASLPAHGGRAPLACVHLALQDTGVMYPYSYGGTTHRNQNKSRSLKAVGSKHIPYDIYSQLACMLIAENNISDHHRPYFLNNDGKQRSSR